MRSNPLQVAEDYVANLTGLGVGGYFTLLRDGPRKVAVFRRLGFVPPDSWTMIRLRLALSDEVTPKVQTSLSNGLLVGRLAFSAQGRMVRGFTSIEKQLLFYLLHEPLGAWTITRKGPGRYLVRYPHDFAEHLVGRAAQMTGAAPHIVSGRNGWMARMGRLRFEIGRFLQSCVIHATPAQISMLFRMDRQSAASLHRLSEPCVLIGFGRTLDVSRAISSRPEQQGQLSDRVFRKLFAAYEIFRKAFLRGKRPPVFPRHPLPEIRNLPVPPLRTWSRHWRPRAPRPRPHLPAAPVSPDRALHREILDRQYTYLLDCLQPGEVSHVVGGHRLSGVISAPDPAIYLPEWSPDHFFNTLAMLDFDPPLAKRMMVGGLIHWMRWSRTHRGQLPCKAVQTGDNSYPPVWALVLERIADRTKDTAWVRKLLPFLELNDAYLTRRFLRDGIYIGAGNFIWNDYSVAPRRNPRVAGIAVQSMIALQKDVLYRLGLRIGIRNERLRDEYERLKEKINQLFWDESCGFYFDYDAAKGALYTTASGGRFYGLDNLLPLVGGLATESRARRMMASITSSRLYGKYPAITTDLSPDFIDERRLMVWPMTNWLVIQGLRRYGRHSIADALGRQIFNALVRNYVEHGALSESLSGNLGFAPMENISLAGVGCWTAFSLYLKEAFRTLSNN